MVSIVDEKNKEESLEGLDDLEKELAVKNDESKRRREKSN